MSTTQPLGPEEPGALNLIGRQVDKYRVIREIGRGGMGAVFEMVHVAIGQRAALKVLFPKYATDQEYKARFLFEAKAANVVKHPGLVQIIDFGQLAEGTLYLVMELLEGESLRSRLTKLGAAGELLPWRHALEMARQLAETLRAVHAKNIIHRDLKPENIFLVEDSALPNRERLKILDFGIAKQQRESDPQRTNTGQLTTVGKVLGTSTYMSPEQCENRREIGPASDVYSLGCVLYELLTERPPFEGASMAALVAQHLRDTPVPPHRIVPSVPRSLSALVLRMMEKAPDARPSIPELCSELTHLLERGPSNRVSWAWGLGLVTMATGVFATVLSFTLPRRATSIDLGAEAGRGTAQTRALAAGALQPPAERFPDAGTTDLAHPAAPALDLGKPLIRPADNKPASLGKGKTPGSVPANRASKNGGIIYREKIVPLDGLTTPPAADADGPR